MKGNQRQELMRIRVVIALTEEEKNPTGCRMTPRSIRIGLIIPPEVDRSHRQTMTMTMVGTIQVRTIHVRATRTPGKVCSRMSAEAIAMHGLRDRVPGDPDDAAPEGQPEGGGRENGEVVRRARRNVPPSQ